MNIILLPLLLLRLYLCIDQKFSSYALALSLSFVFEKKRTGEEEKQSSFIHGLSICII